MDERNGDDDESSAIDFGFEKNDFVFALKG
jgi:hypothetical protein